MARILAAREQLTRQNLDAQEAPACGAGQIARLAEEISHAERAITEAEKTEAERSDLRHHQRDLKDKLTRLSLQIEGLEAAKASLDRAQQAGVDLQHLGEQARQLQELYEDLERAGREVEREGEDSQDVDRELPYPADFRARAARIEELWDQRKQCRIKTKQQMDALGKSGVLPAAVTIIAALGGLAVSAGVWVVSGSIIALPVALVATSVTIWSLTRRRKELALRAEGERVLRSLADQIKEVKRELAGLLRGIPEGNELRRDRLREHLQRFERQEPLRNTDLQAEASYRDAVDRVSSHFDADRDLVPPDEAKALLPWLADRLSEARENLKVAKDEPTADRPVDLPDDVEPNREAVERALRDRHASRDRLQRQFKETERALAAVRAPVCTPLASSDRLRSLQSKKGRPPAP
ncbi:MAG: hypothetical protein ACE5HV_03385 [Acidobacteriota bacterium]